MCLAVPARLVQILPESRGTVEIGGVQQEVSLDLIDEPAIGDYLIVHVGFALRKLDPVEAQKTLDLFAEFLHDVGEPAVPDPPGQPIK